MPTTDYSAQLAEVLELVLSAGELALAWRGRVTGVGKPDGSLATEADLEVEQFLVEGLRRRFPGDAFAGEEGQGEAVVGPGRLWSLDPIDGTHNFIAGLPLWALSVGLIEAGRPVLGVVHAPLLGQTFTAAAGAGACLNGQPLGAPSAAPLRPNDLVGLPHDFPPDVLPVPHKNRSVGSSALHACWVAAGSFRATLITNWALWDLAAAFAVAAQTGVEARWPHGARLEDLTGLSALTRFPVVLLAPRGLCADLLAAMRLPA